MAVLLIPQAMAYAMLAGLPPVMGLYAAMVPLFAYAMLGTSRQLQVGPVALDFLLLLYAFFATLLLGVQYGILLSVLASMAMILNRITRPPIVEFDRIPDTDIFRNLERDTDAKEIEGVIIFRIDASLYFSNVSYLRDQVYKSVFQRSSKVSCFIIDASSINEVDSTACSALDEMAVELNQLGIWLCFTNVKGRVKDFLKQTGFYDPLGQEHFFFSKREAVDAFIAQQKVLSGDTVISTTSRTTKLKRSD